MITLITLIIYYKLLLKLFILDSYFPDLKKFITLSIS